MRGEVPSDVLAFLSTARALYPWLALAWLALLLKVRRPAWLLLGALGANAWVWFVTTEPLGRLYALGVSQDRWNNIAMCQVVAAGHSPLETWQVGQTHLGPHLRPYVMLWTVLVAALSGFDPERLLHVYEALPALLSAGFAISVFLALRRSVPGGPWAAAVMAASATLLASSPLEFQGPYGVPWAQTFLLKPNHALGLVLMPVALQAFASISGWRGRLGVALLLHALGWAFALHLAFFAAGLAAFVLVTALARRDERRRDALDVAVTVGLNALVVLPYVARLLLRDAGPAAASHPVLGAERALLAEATLRHSPLFLLGAWGAVAALRQGDRLGRLLAGQLAGAILVWAGYASFAAAGAVRGGLATALFEQPDEAYYWLRFVTALLAGLGAWDLAQSAAARWPAARWDPPRLAAALGLLALPWTLPYWWDPVRMDRYFRASIPPLSPVLTGAAAYLRERTDPAVVLAGDPYFTREAAALTGRRAVSTMGLPQPADVVERGRIERALLSSPRPEAASEAVARYGATHVAVTPLILSTYGIALSDIDARPGWRRLALFGDPGGDFVALYELAAP